MPENLNIGFRTFLFSDKIVRQEWVFHKPQAGLLRIPVFPVFSFLFGIFQFSLYICDKFFLQFAQLFLISADTAKHYLILFSLQQDSLGTTVGSIQAFTAQIPEIRMLQKMAELRVVCDEAETLTAAKYWPFPTYGDLLFGVR